MKRTLLTAITLYLLVVRQKRVEARTKAWQRGASRELRDWMVDFGGECNQLAMSLSASQDDLITEVNKAFKGIAGGKR